MRCRPRCRRRRTHWVPDRTHGGWEGRHTPALPRLPYGSSPALSILPGRELDLHLRHASGRQVLRPRPSGAPGHLALFPARSQDRRAGAERRGQVDAASDHGRRRHELVGGRAELAPGATVGFLLSGAGARPEQGRAWQRRGRRSREAALLDRFNELCAGLQSRCRIRRWRHCWRSRARCRTGSSGSTPGTSTQLLETRWTHCGCRRRTPTFPRSPAASGGGWRCAGCCSQQPDLLLLDEPTNHLDAESRRLAGAVTWQRLSRHGVGGHPRPLLPRQRGRLDPRARPRPRHALRGQLLLVAGAEGGAAGQEEKQARSPPHAGAGAGVGAHGAARAAREVQGALERLRAVAGRGAGA